MSDLKTIDFQVGRVAEALRAMLITGFKGKITLRVDEAGIQQKILKEVTDTISFK